ncbi:hypothetical protein B0J14DRAFT_560647 [Halenospora varia]|nr:hypothetical protein B0J14DRAFT_560647 [Halenospora varia]
MPLWLPSLTVRAISKGTSVNEARTPNLVRLLEKTYTIAYRMTTISSNQSTRDDSGYQRRHSINPSTIKEILIFTGVQDRYEDEILDVLNEGKDPEGITRVMCKYNQSTSNIEMQYTFRRGLRITNFALGGLYTSYSSSIASIIAGRPITPDQKSDAICDLVPRWVKQCTKKHAHCEKIRDVKLPTRVIDVGSSENLETPFLFEPSDDFTGRYLALSHCWGKVSPKYQLTKATLD